MRVIKLVMLAVSGLYVVLFRFGAILMVWDLMEIISGLGLSVCWGLPLVFYVFMLCSCVSCLVVWSRAVSAGFRIYINLPSGDSL